MISALGWKGPEHRIYAMCRSGVLSLATSPELLSELRRALAYPKFGFTSDEREAFARDLLTHAVVVDPSLTLDVVQDDPADNRVLECAVESGAEWIVSGDGHLLELGVFREIRILRASEAEEIIRRGE